MTTVDVQEFYKGSGYKVVLSGYPLKANIPLQTFSSASQDGETQYERLNHAYQKALEFANELSDELALTVSTACDPPEKPFEPIITYIRGPRQGFKTTLALEGMRNLAMSPNVNALAIIAGTRQQTELFRERVEARLPTEKGPTVFTAWHQDKVLGKNVFYLNHDSPDVGRGVEVDAVIVDLDYGSDSDVFINDLRLRFPNAKFFLVTIQDPAHS